MPQQTIHAATYKDAASDQRVAQCIEYDVVTQGDSREHAVAMIREAVELDLEDVSEKELELFYQPVEGDVTLHEVAIDAPTLLRS